MNRDEFESRVMEFITGAMTAEEQEVWEQWLGTHPAEKQEVMEQKALWQQLESLPTRLPSKKMDDAFYAMLHKQSPQSAERRTVMERLFADSWIPRMAIGIFLLAAGLVSGYFLRPGLPEAALPAEQMTTADQSKPDNEPVLTLLDEPEVSRRLQRVNEVGKSGSADEKVILALLHTLNKDSNVNVRLAAIEALSHYVDNEQVRTGLVESIVQQDSPIVQVTLASLMVALQEKESVPHFRKLIMTENLDTTVKKKLERSIHQII